MSYVGVLAHNLRYFCLIIVVLRLLFSLTLLTLRIVG